MVQIPRIPNKKYFHEPALTFSYFGSRSTTTELLFAHGLKKFVPEKKKIERETLKFVGEEKKKRNSLAPEYVFQASPFIKERKRELSRKKNPNVINCEKSA